VELNTDFTDLLGCPLLLHKIHVDPPDTSVEAVEFGHIHPNQRPPHSSRTTAVLSSPNYFYYMSPVASMRVAPVVVVALLVVTAGCSAFSGSAEDPSTVAPRLNETTTATSTPEGNSGDPSYPTGVTPNADDAVDERALVIAHDRALEDRSLTWQYQQVWTNSTGTVVYWTGETTWTTNSTQRYESEDGGVAPTTVTPPSTEYDFWTNGSTTVSHQVLPNGSVVVSVDQGGPPSTFATVDVGRTFLESALIGRELAYVGTEQRPNTDRYVLTTTRSESQLTVRVTAEGIIRSFVLQTQTVADGEQLTVVRRFRTYGIGTTTVEKPPWAANSTK